MYNTFADIHKIKYQLVNSILGELEEILKGDTYTANYWLDNAHNVFATKDDTGRSEWIEIHFELYQAEEHIGDILVVDTDEVSQTELIKAVKEIVDKYLYV